MNGKQSKKLRSLAQVFFNMDKKPPSLINMSLDKIYEHLKTKHKTKLKK